VAEKNEKRILHPRGSFVQWTGVLAGPVAWGLHMQTNYSLVPWVCKNGGEIFIHLVTIAALLITAVGALAAWRGWQQGRDEEEANGEGSRSHFMGALGLLTSGMFFLVIIAQEIPSFIFHPCQR
jgi:hypothetical protein